MGVKKIFFYLNEIKYVKSVLKTYGDSLVAGKYHQYNCFRALSLDNAEVIERASKHFQKRVVNDKRMAQIAQHLNNIKFFRNRNKHSTEEYVAIYIANHFERAREIKLFSFKHNKVLTICTNGEEVQKQMEWYNSFSTAYNMPKMKKNDRYENAIEIDMVTLKAYNGELEALECIANSVIAYNPATNFLTSMSVETIAALEYDADINGYLKQISDKIDSQLMDVKIPLCVQHGDLSKDNLIHGESDGKTTFWWIDWEHVRERIFFYDYFFYIINSALYDDMSAFDAYLSDEANKNLDTYFKHFGLVFDKEKKFDYFLIFTIAVLKERVCTKSGLPVVKKYFDLIVKMEHYFKENKIDEARFS